MRAHRPRPCRTAARAPAIRPAAYPPRPASRRHLSPRPRQRPRTLATSLPTSPGSSTRRRRTHRDRPPAPAGDPRQGRRSVALRDAAGPGSAACTLAVPAAPTMLAPRRPAQPSSPSDPKRRASTFAAGHAFAGSLPAASHRRSSVAVLNASQRPVRSKAMQKVVRSFSPGTASSPRPDRRGPASGSQRPKRHDPRPIERRGRGQAGQCVTVRRGDSAHRIEVQCRDGLLTQAAHLEQQGFPLRGDGEQTAAGAKRRAGRCRRRRSPRPAAGRPPRPTT